jgi:hypothetical protein
MGRDVFADEMPARLMFVQSRLAKTQGVIDNGLLYVHKSTCDRQQRLFDTATADFERLEDADERMKLASRYCQSSELFEKWALWRHLSRASAKLDAATVADQGAAANSN